MGVLELFRVERLLGAAGKDDVGAHFAESERHRAAEAAAGVRTASARSSSAI